MNDRVDGNFLEGTTEELEKAGMVGYSEGVVHVV